MDVQLKMDYGPIFTQLFAIHAKIDALTDIIATTKEQQEKLDELFKNHFKRIVTEFDEQFPGIIDKNPFK
jgi:hypothetical protein